MSITSVYILFMKLLSFGDSTLESGTTANAAETTEATETTTTTASAGDNAMTATNRDADHGKMSIAQAESLRKVCTNFGSGKNSRKALIIGNATYRRSLPNPLRDADMMASILKDAGFDGIMCKDLENALMASVTTFFMEGLDNDDTAMFYFSGHGSEIDGENYLIGVDPTRQKQRARFPLSTVMSLFKARDERTTNIIMLDACRTDPNAKDDDLGFKSEIASLGFYIAFGSAPGEPSYDNEKMKNSYFTSAFAETIKENPSLDIDLLFRKAREKVLKWTFGQQMPWSNHALVGEFRFHETP